MIKLTAILATIARLILRIFRGRTPRIDRGMPREIRAARHNAARGSARDINRRLADLERRRQAARNAT